MLLAWTAAFTIAIVAGILLLFGLLIAVRCVLPPGWPRWVCDLVMAVAGLIIALTW